MMRPLSERDAARPGHCPEHQHGRHREQNTFHGVAPVVPRGPDRALCSMRSVAADQTAFRSLATTTPEPVTCAVASIAASMTVVSEPAPIARSR